MASKRRNMFQKNKTQETTENGAEKMICYRVKMMDFLKPYDKLNHQVVSRADFLRGLDSCKFDLSQTQLDTIMDVCCLGHNTGSTTIEERSMRLDPSRFRFSSPEDPDKIEYRRFCLTVDEESQAPCLQRTPLKEAMEEAMTSKPLPVHGFVNFEERVIISTACEKLCRRITLGSIDVFKGKIASMGTVLHLQSLNDVDGKFQNMVEKRRQKQACAICHLFVIASPADHPTLRAPATMRKRFIVGLQGPARSEEIRALREQPKEHSHLTSELKGESFKNLAVALRSFDKEGSGTVGRHDFLTILQMLNTHTLLTPKEVDTLVKGFGVNHKGSIRLDYLPFLNSLDIVFRTKKAAQNMFRRLDAIFTLSDCGCCGYPQFYNYQRNTSSRIALRWRHKGRPSLIMVSDSLDESSINLIGSFDEEIAPFGVCDWKKVQKKKLGIFRAGDAPIDRRSEGPHLCQFPLLQIYLPQKNPIANYQRRETRRKRRGRYRRAPELKRALIAKGGGRGAPEFPFEATGGFTGTKCYSPPSPAMALECRTTYLHQVAGKVSPNVKLDLYKVTTRVLVEFE
ncbi:hypothetical protein AAG570_006654 [Ranatra chinensis]|uniref:EF-hand domain-containing protein n=1 Tax=Ranatra chinensis TaxID=642074 RepID=A0ABD0YUP9_9HEMI